MSGRRKAVAERLEEIDHRRDKLEAEIGDATDAIVTAIERGDAAAEETGRAARRAAQDELASLALERPEIDAALAEIEEQESRESAARRSHQVVEALEQAWAEYERVCDLNPVAELREYRRQQWDCRAKIHFLSAEKAALAAVYPGLPTPGLREPPERFDQESLRRELIAFVAELANAPWQAAPLKMLEQARAARGEATRRGAFHWLVSNLARETGELLEGRFEQLQRQED